MTHNINLQTFFQLAFTELKAIRARYGRYLLIVAACSAACDMFIWHQGENSSYLDIIIGAAFIAIWTYLVYAITVLSMDKNLSIIGFTKYALTGILLIIPATIGFVLLLLSAADKNIVLLVPSAIIMFSGLFFISVMQGWPAIQAVSGKIIGPIAAFKATQGIRIALVIAGLLLSAFNRGIPPLTSDASIYLAVPHALFGGFIFVIFTLLSATLAVTSAKVMIQRI